MQFFYHQTILRKARRTTSFDFLLYGLTVKNLRGIAIVLVYYMYVGTSTSYIYLVYCFLVHIAK